MCYLVVPIRHKMYFLLAWLKCMFSSFVSLYYQETYLIARPIGHKTSFMLNSTEHEILLLNVKMPIIVGILIFMRRIIIIIDDLNLKIPLILGISIFMSLTFCAQLS